MFLCPHCQFENPAQNRFCQQCGSPLKSLRALLTWEEGATSQPATPPPEMPTTEGLSADLDIARMSSKNQPDSAAGTLLKSLMDSQFLDAEKRYQVLTSPAAIADLQTFAKSASLELVVLDCRPGELSPLAQWLETNGERDDLSDLKDILPAMAYRHWQLQECFFPMVPELQAAWRDRGGVITVFEDRDTWASLAEVLTAEQVDPLELIHWIYQVVNLWDDFVAAGVEVSLLAVENLCVDDDQILCLKRLMETPQNQTFTFQDLGKFWIPLLENLPAANTTPLMTVLMAMTTGELSDAEHIAEHLVAIAEVLEGASLEAGAIEADEADVFPEEATDSFEMPTNRIEVTASPMLGAEATPAPTEPEDSVAAEPDGEAGAELPSQVLANLIDRMEDEEDLEEEVVAEDGLGDLPTMALPMKLYQVDEVGRTHVGRQRAHNEDSFFAETRLQKLDGPLGTTLSVQGLYILCDGMGGHSGGEVASALAVNSLREYFRTHWQTGLPSSEVIQEGILQANQVIFAQNELEARSGSARMGTTLVMVLLTDNQSVVAHVGDSRLYCLTRNDFKQSTVDHEVGQREINRGVEPAIAYARPDAYQLTQALGPRSNQEVVPSITFLPVNQDTLFLLCSDGLSDNDLLETHVESHLRPLLRSHADLEEGVADLIDLANEHNGHDNITAIAVRVKVRPNLEALPSSLPMPPLS